MQFLEHVLLALLAFSCATLAAPTANDDKGLDISLNKKRDAFLLPDSQTIDFNKVSQHMNQLKAKYADSLKGYKANTGSVHPLQIPGVSLAKRATGSVPLTDVQDALWHGAITLGSTTTQCDFDTGSSDIIIEPSGYKPGKSAKNTGQTFQAAYGDGTTASGTVYKDTITIGGLKAGNVSIGRSNSDFLDPSEGDKGICGMGFPSISVLGSGSTPFFDGLIKAKVVTSKKFTFTLSSTNSRMYLGGIDPNAGTPNYVNVASDSGFWLVQTSSINNAATSSIVDTGTSLIVAPTNYAQAFFNAVGATSFTQDGTLYGAYTCSKPPTVTYKFGTFSINLSASTVSFGKTNDGRCVLSLVGEDIGINAVIAGDSFLRNVHAVFDRNRNRVGFTKQ